LLFFGEFKLKIKTTVIPSLLATFIMGI